MSRTLDPQLSFADLELSRLGVHLDPLLQGIDSFLELHSNLIEHVRLDLERGLKNPSCGKEGLPSASLAEFALDHEGAIWAGSTRGLFRFTKSIGRRSARSGVSPPNRR